MTLSHVTLEFDFDLDEWNKGRNRSETKTLEQAATEIVNRMTDKYVTSVGLTNVVYIIITN